VQIVLAATVLAERALRTQFGVAHGARILISGLLTGASAAAYLVGWLRHMSGYGETQTLDG